MNDLLWVLTGILACAIAHAWVETRTPPPATPPRRNYDVLAPPPRSQATRVAHDAIVDGIWGAEAVARDVRLTLRVFGPRNDTILVIRPEVRDGRQ